MITDASLTPLCGWARRRERQRRAACLTWLGCLVLGGTGALLDDALLYAPLPPLLVGGGWLIGVRVGDLWWRARSRRAGHPLVRAYAPSTLVRGHAPPPGWSETLIAGSLHLTDGGWRWRPSPLGTGDFTVLTWPCRSVVAVAAIPLWAPPAATPSAQLRLYLRSGGTADLLIWDPAALGLDVGGPAAR